MIIPDNMTNCGLMDIASVFIDYTALFIVVALMAFCCFKEQIMKLLFRDTTKEEEIIDDDEDDEIWNFQFKKQKKDM